MSTMPLDTLRVIHRTGESKFTSEFSADGFFTGPPVFVDTCQRSIWVGQKAQRPNVVGVTTGIEIFSGKKAYEFLLRFASGLLSAIPGETNVFGQLKAAWQHHQALFGVNACTLNQYLMAQLFTDTKRIRSKCLQRIGGRSYGTLIRLLLELHKNDQVLIIGSGNLAHSIAPTLHKYRLATWSRSTTARVPGKAEVHFTYGDEMDAARWATHIIFCTPPARDFEQVWIEALQKHPVKSVVHLGYHQAPAWWREYVRGGARYEHLEHLFALRRNRADARSLQFKRAHTECKSLAATRADDSHYFKFPQAGSRSAVASL